MTIRHVTVALMIPVTGDEPVPTSATQEEIATFFGKYDASSEDLPPQFVAVLDPLHPQGGMEPQVFAAHRPKTDNRDPMLAGYGD